MISLDQSKSSKSKLLSIKHQAIFDSFKKNGVKHYGSCFLIITSLTQNIYPSNFALGMKVTKKLGNAVYRNKIKRRIRHIFSLLKTKSSLQNLNILIIPRKEFFDGNFQNLAVEITKYLKFKYSSIFKI